MWPSAKVSFRAKGRGYTVIEVMIALTVLAIGTSGVIAMQKVTTTANRDARSLAVATQIARTWVERLRVDALAWNQPSPAFPGGDDRASDTKWLANVDTGWFRPQSATEWPSFDAFGNDVPDGLTAANSAVYCTHVRLGWLYGPPSLTTPAPYLIRAEVRVFWRREGSGALAGGSSWICDQGQDMTQVGSAVDKYHFVYLTSAIRQNL